MIGRISRIFRISESEFIKKYTHNSEIQNERAFLFDAFLLFAMVKYVKRNIFIQNFRSWPEFLFCL